MHTGAVAGGVISGAYPAEANLGLGFQVPAVFLCLTEAIFNRQAGAPVVVAAGYFGIAGIEEIVVIAVFEPSLFGDNIKEMPLISQPAAIGTNG